MSWYYYAHKFLKDFYINETINGHKIVETFVDPFGISYGHKNNKII